MLLFSSSTLPKAVLDFEEYCRPDLHLRVWSLVCGLLRLLYKLQKTQSCCTLATASNKHLQAEAPLDTSLLDVSSAWLML